jgi:AcrR family transcriptional regulator
MPASRPTRGARQKRTGAGVKSASTPKPRSRDAEVLDVAAEIFYERGYASATVQDVADALGMLKGSLYYYIDGKEDLLYRLMQEIHDGIDEVLSGVTALDGLSAIERIDLYTQRNVAFNARHLKKISVYYHDVDQLGEPRRHEILRRRRAHEDLLVDLVREAQDAGDVADDLDPKLLVNYLFGAVIWMYRWYRPGSGISVEEVSATCSRFIRFGLTGHAPNAEIDGQVAVSGGVVSSGVKAVAGRLPSITGADVANPA